MVVDDVCLSVSRKIVFSMQRLVCRFLAGEEEALLPLSVLMDLAGEGGRASRHQGGGGGPSSGSSPAGPGVGGGSNATGGGTFRIAEVAASTPEMRFLKHFYTAVSLLTDPDGL